jgi:Zn-dependent protease
MADMEQYPHEWRDYEPIQPRGFDWRAFLRKLWAPISFIGVALAKYGAVLFKFKFLFSMFVSAAVYVWLGGWWFGIGLVVLLFIHEMGHVAEAKRQGLPVSAPLFIPFMGALISMKQMPHDAWREARLALGGPLLGSAGAALIYLAGVAFDSQSLKALAFLGFFINLFNLLPVLPLDGGRAMAALTPWMWLAGFAGLVALTFYFPNPIMLLVIVFGGVESWRRWRLRHTPEGRAYHAIRPGTRALVAATYVGLAGLLAVGVAETYVSRGIG